MRTVPAVSVVLLVAWGRCGDGQRAEPEQAKTAPARGQERPLETIYATSKQVGVKRIGDDKAYGRVLDDLFGAARPLGASTVFLVSADDIGHAIQGTLAVFTLGESADTPVRPRQQPRATQVWFVAYLGTSGSTPPAWFVKSVHQVGKTVRLTYEKRGAQTDNLLPYFVWADLGKLESGTYDLELFDNDKRHVTVLRRVTVRTK